MKDVPATVLFKLTAVVPLPQSVWVEGEADPTGVELTVSEEALVPVPPGPVTETVPDVVADATVHVIVVALTTVILVAEVPLIETPVAPVKPVPVIVNCAPVQIGEGLKLVTSGTLYTHTEPFKVPKPFPFLAIRIR